MEQDKIKVGASFQGPLKFMSFARMCAFSGGALDEDGWPRTSIHTDRDYARSVGLDTAGAAGVQYQGHVVELLVDVFGPQWLSSGTMKGLSFIRPVPEGLRMRASATVISEEDIDEGTLMTMDVSCLDEAGDPVLVGKATAVRAKSTQEKVMQNA